MKATRIFLAIFAMVLFSVPAAAEPYNVRITHQLPDSHHIGVNVKYFKSLVEEKTKGKVVVEVYPAAQAFKPKEAINAVITGGIEAAVTTNFEWAGMLPIMDVVLIPWVITDLSVIEKALSGEPGKMLFKTLESKGVIPLMWFLQCRTNLYTSNKAPLLTAADFK